MGDKKDILYILGTVVLFGLMGLYLAFSQGGSLNSILTIPGRTKPLVSLTPSNTSSPEEVVVETSQTPIDSTLDYYAKIETNLGILEVDLYEKNAPNSVKNFIHLANSRYYDGTKFHRYIPNGLIQGGSRNTLNADPSDDKLGGPGYIIPDETNWDSLSLSDPRKTELTSLGYASNQSVQSISMDRYMLAFASSGPNTNGSQFFVVLGNKEEEIVKGLEGIHTVFGQVILGREIIDALSLLPVNLDNLEDPRPSNDLIINKLTIEVR